MKTCRPHKHVSHTNLLNIYTVAATRIATLETAGVSVPPQTQAAANELREELEVRLQQVHEC